MPEQPTKTIRTESRGGVLLLEVDARQLTALTAVDEFDRQLRQLLQHQTERSWIIDFHDVTFLVTPAINTLLVVLKKLRGDGGMLVLCGLNENIRRVFTLMKLDQVFVLRRDAAEALRGLTSSGAQGPAPKRTPPATN